MSNQRLLTTTEIVNLLARHPIIAAKVTATKLLLASGRYEMIYTAPSGIEIDIDLSNIGVIPANGLAFEDANYGLVVIQPAPNGKIYFNGFVTSIGGAATINLPKYESPTTPPGTEPCDWLCKLDKATSMGLLVVGVLIVSTVYRNLKK